MEPHVDNHKEYRKHRPLHVTLYDFIESVAMQCCAIGLSFNGRVIILAVLLDYIAYLYLEVCY